MAPLDLTAGLPDIDPDAPTGPNLEVDGDFGALERAAQGSPERQSGTKIIPAEDPVWKDVAAQAAALLERTHDLRVLTHLAIARLNLTGLADFVAVLAMIRQLLATRWEQVHPQLDPEDDNDPTLRANALLQLAHPLRVLRTLRALRLVTSERAGIVSWRTIALSTGAIEGEGEKKTEAEIRAAFAESGPARTTALRELIAAALAEVAGIGTEFDTRGGYGTSPDLSPLSKLLQEIGRYVEIYGVTESAAPAPDIAEDAVAADDGGGGVAGGGSDGGGHGAPRQGGVSVASLTAVTTRADAVRLLDLVCRYYEQYEPSSPLPLLLGRARNLADKGFLEILQDLAPDGLMQAQVVVQPRGS